MTGVAALFIFFHFILQDGVRQLSTIFWFLNAVEKIESDADTLEKIIGEVAAARKTERGGRMDDKRSQSAMEDRKKEGYF